MLEFKDREQVRGLLALSLGRENRSEISSVLMDYIKNPKCLLYGFAEGPAAHGIIGIRLLDRKEAEIKHLAVRNEEDENPLLQEELIKHTREKHGLKKISVVANSQSKHIYEKLGFELADKSNDHTETTCFHYVKVFSN